MHCKKILNRIQLIFFFHVKAKRQINVRQLLIRNRHYSVHIIENAVDMKKCRDNVIQQNTKAWLCLTLIVNVKKCR